MSKLPTSARFILTVVIAFGLCLAIQYVKDALIDGVAYKPAWIYCVGIAIVCGFLELAIPHSKRKQNREDLKNAFKKKD